MPSDTPAMGDTLGERAVQVAERFASRLEAVEQQLIEQRSELRTLQDLTRAAGGALARIAAAEGERAELAKLEAQDRREAAKLAAASRATLLDRLVSSPLTYIAAAALLALLLQALGFPQIAERVPILPSAAGVR